MKLSEKLKLVPFSRSRVKTGAPQMENLSSVSYSLRLSVLLESWKEWGSGKWCSGSVLSRTTLN